VNTARSWGARTARRVQLEGKWEGHSIASDGDGAVEMLMRLPPRQRACLYLRFVEDLAVVDVARHLGCSTGTVKSQTSKALTTLRSLLENEAELGGRTA
jgi:DNA-directed RNA polymerase specialized sigma24 family protein